MAWFKTGGGKEINLGRPDVTKQVNLAVNGTTSVAVTQKPRALIYSYVLQTSAAGGVWLVNLDTMEYKRLYYGSNGYDQSEGTTSIGGTILQTVSDTTVTVKNYTASSALRLNLAIYY